MALSPAQVNKVATILQVTPLHIEGQIIWLSDRMTSVLQTAIEDEIDRWDAGIGTNFIDVDPNLANFGAIIRADREKNDIRKNIATLLERPEWARGNAMQIEMVRG